MYPEKEGEDFHVCVINIGHYQTGTCLLATAAKNLGLKVNLKFPNLNQDQMKGLLMNPKATVL